MFANRLLTKLEHFLWNQSYWLLMFDSVVEGQKLKLPLKEGEDRMNEWMSEGLNSQAVSWWFSCLLLLVVMKTGLESPATFAWLKSSSCFVSPSFTLESASFSRLSSLSRLLSRLLSSFTRQRSAFSLRVWRKRWRWLYFLNNLHHHLFRLFLFSSFCLLVFVVLFGPAFQVFFLFWYSIVRRETGHLTSISKGFTVCHIKSTAFDHTMMTMAMMSGVKRFPVNLVMTTTSGGMKSGIHQTSLLAPAVVSGVNYKR